MVRFISGLLFLLAAGFLFFIQSPIGFYLKPKQERLYVLWQKDMDHLANNKEFQNMLNQLGKVEIQFTDPQVATEFEEFQSPFKVTSGYPYTLKISVTRWIEKNEYGFVVQHELFDETDDKVYEFGRTYKVGYIL